MASPHPACPPPPDWLRTLLDRDYPVEGGIVQAIPTDMRPLVDAEQQAWRRVAQAGRACPLTPEDLLHLPEEPRTRALLDWLKGVLAARGRCRVLDLGAGRGWAARALAAKGHHVVAADLLDDADIGLGCAVRLRAAGGPWFACVRARAEALPFRPESFDCVVCFAVLQHVHDLDRALGEVAAVLQPGGLFLALEEGFRGSLTTPGQSQQDGLALTLTRRAPEEPGNRPEERWQPVVQGFGPHEIRRRVPRFLASAAAVGLCGRIVPADVVPALPADFVRTAWPTDRRTAPWLTPLAVAYDLDAARLQAWTRAAEETLRVELGPPLLAHWTLVGNLEGALLARKTPAPAPPTVGDCRDFDALLLACSREGFVPIYGVGPSQSDPDGPFRWLQPQAGLLVPAGEAVELTVTAPQRPPAEQATRLEVWIEELEYPLLAIAIPPGETARLRVPLPPVSTASLLLRLRVAPGLVLPGEPSGEFGESRVAAVQLKGIRTAAVTADQVADGLTRFAAARAQAAA
jgi:SAM-dependent methyltransferase